MTRQLPPPPRPASQSARLSAPQSTPDRGLYILWLHLPRPLTVRIGALGTVSLAPGRYAYVGSAQRHRAARLDRHRRTEKPQRWHIDYLRPHVTLVAVELVDGGRDEECRLVSALLAQGGRRAVRGFGSGDCRCGGHLLTWAPGVPGGEPAGGPAGEPPAGFAKVDPE